MLAATDGAALDDARLVYEPKYDGIRALIEVAPSAVRGESPRVAIWSRNGNDKTAQFPDLVPAVAGLVARRRSALLLDGEIVALDAEGRPTSFLKLQPRIHRHRTTARESARAVRDQPVVFVAFDLLDDGDESLRGRPFTERRARLEQRLGRTRRKLVWLSECAVGDGRELHARAQRDGWEGLIAKEATSIYHNGKRSPAWQKIKLLRSQEFVVGGWTAPRQSRQHFGALIVGVRGDNADEAEVPGLTYAGHVGSGFSDAELARLAKLLGPLSVADSPFTAMPPAHETAHWVEPVLVVQVKFTEWPDGGALRHPVYLGLRDDRPARSVTREGAPAGPADPSALDPMGGIDALAERLEDLEQARRRGTLELDGVRVAVGNLDKVFWPALGVTKGELLRFYVRIAPYVLPAVADRPLVMKRFPNGIDGKSFYQHRAPSPLPDGLPALPLRESPDRPETEVPYLVGGSLATLLYMAQLAAISQDPWFSRVSAIESADLTAFDLDPGPGVRFRQVLDVACWIHDELDKIGVPSVPKTSGSSGLHIYLPLPDDTPYEAGMLLCQIVATLVASRHPKVATVERMVKRRREKTVYIDYLQNIYGKTLATAYSARASDYAGVSTPLTWREVHAGAKQKLDPRAFTIRSVMGRLERVGDLWAALRTGEKANLRAAAALTTNG
ncbi:MAG: DNA ligase D [Vicinamibacterales bacterium]|jgi:bifunctional non-homologous end joining protein LigD|nr:DNA ligase D [Vicinamibacterales bacterium]MDP6607589.1 DNA ligase D [Vicinamibacterales bacterium]|tara:strand:- start:80 stop:2098 length:2019 start_codon:yes stop_codon:yes gene_type:complete